jgi:hypothetical protein
MIGSSNKSSNFMSFVDLGKSSKIIHVLNNFTLERTVHKSTYVRRYVCRYVRIYVNTYVHMHPCMYVHVHKYVCSLCTYLHGYVPNICTYVQR